MCRHITRAREVSMASVSPGSRPSGAAGLGRTRQQVAVSGDDGVADRARPGDGRDEEEGAHDLVTAACSQQRPSDGLMPSVRPAPIDPPGRLRGVPPRDTETCKLGVGQALGSHDASRRLRGPPRLDPARRGGAMRAITVIDERRPGSIAHAASVGSAPRCTTGMWISLDEVPGDEVPTPPGGQREPLGFAFRNVEQEPEVGRASHCRTSM